MREVIYGSEVIRNPDLAILKIANHSFDYREYVPIVIGLSSSFPAEAFLPGELAELEPFPTS